MITVTEPRLILTDFIHILSDLVFPYTGQVNFRSITYDPIWFVLYEFTVSSRCIQTHRDHVPAFTKDTGRYIVSARRIFIPCTAYENSVHIDSVIMDKRTHRKSCMPSGHRGRHIELLPHPYRALDHKSVFVPCPRHRHRLPVGIIPFRKVPSAFTFVHCRLFHSEQGFPV